VSLESPGQAWGVYELIVFITDIFLSRPFENGWQWEVEGLEHEVENLARKSKPFAPLGYCNEEVVGEAG
jgi:hypothetical protein